VEHARIIKASETALRLIQTISFEASLSEKGGK
jgi:hypothetical protein